MKENIKNQILKIFELFFAILLFLFLFINLVSSQSISSLYFKFIGGDKKSVVSYLQKIKNLTIFNKELNKSKNLFGKDIENDVFQPDIERDITIKEFEQILKKSPQSRDILYSLYQLYLEKGDTVAAKKYFQQAKAIDPTIIINN